MKIGNRKIERVRALWFSPTGNTKKVVLDVVRLLTEQLAVPLEEDSFTLPSEREHLRHFDEETLLVVGLPTYAGRLPNKMLPFLESHLLGEGTSAVAITTFGNRSKDESLKELVDLLTKQGFFVLGGAGICTRHAFAEIGPEAPDEEGMESFVHGIIEKIHSTIGESIPVELLPGEEGIGPYYVPKGEDGEPVNFLKAKPITEEHCTRCGSCLAICPMDSIKMVDGNIETPGICIKCQACIEVCPSGARVFQNPLFLSHKRMLEREHADRKNSEFYI